MNPQSHIARRAWPMIAAIVAISAAVAPARSATVKDALGRQVKIENSSRIISIGGAITEILYAMGLEDRIIGVDVTSLYPPQAMKEKPNVGYMRQLSPEGVLGLGPTLVLANDGSGPKDAIAVLEGASVPFVRIPDHFTADGIVERIRLVAAAAGYPARGECLVKQVNAGLSQLVTLRKGIERPARVVFILSFTNGKPMIAGRGTAADGIIKLAGAENAFSDFEGYKMVSDEAIVAAQPDAILGMKRSNFNMTPEEIFQYPAFALTPAAKRKSYISMDGLYLLGFGPRTAFAASDLAHALYPALPAEKREENSHPASCRE
jgi:iron complex transport system substrate-binding protein